MSKDYLSCDRPRKFNEDYQIQGDRFTSEFLNDIKYFGIPNHPLWNDPKK